MSLRSIYGGLTTNIVLGVLLYCVNKYVENTQDPNYLFYGLHVLSNLSIIILYYFISKWTTVRTWTFYLVVIPLFLTSCFDVYVGSETWRKPNHFIMRQYLDANDPHLHSIFVTMYVFLNGTLLHLINFIILYRMSNGLSARSLLIFNSMIGAFILTMYCFVALTSGKELHPLTKAFIPTVVTNLAMPFGAFNLPRRSILNFQAKIPNYSSKIMVALLLFTVLIFVTKGLVLLGADMSILHLVRENDPMILLNDIDVTYSFSGVQILLYSIVALPILLICVYSQLSSKKPSYLWELSIIQTSVIITGQFYFIAGALFWKTPKEFRIDPCNISFWVINLIPVATVLMQLNSLFAYRVEVKTDKIKKKLA